MPTIHTKFKLDSEKFGVKHRGKLRGINRDLVLYQYDGKEWNRLEDEQQRDAVGHGVGEVTDEQLKEWGKSKAEWYIDG